MKDWLQMIEMLCYLNATSKDQMLQPRNAEYHVHITSNPEEDGLQQQVKTPGLSGVS